MAMALPAHAQIFWRGADGRDSIQANVIFTTGDLHTLQHEVSYDVGGTPHQLQPKDNVKGLRIDGKTFMNVKVQQPDGRVQQMFAHRIQSLEGMPTIYQIYDEQDKPTKYVQVNDGILTPLVTKPVDADDALHRELIRLNDAKGGNAIIADYLRKLRPTRHNMREAKLVIDSQNPNRIDRVRWGVGAGVTICKTEAWGMRYEKPSSDYDYSFGTITQPQLSLTLFADIPSANCGMSMHPELTFRQASFHDKAIWRDDHSYTEMAYNFTMLEVPLMFRYTFIKLRGHWLPYLEAGMHFGYIMRNENKICQPTRGNEDYIVKYSYLTEKGERSVFQPAAGAGIEYRHPSGHSVYLGARLVEAHKKNVGSWLYTKQSALTINLSYSL